MAESGDPSLRFGEVDPGIALWMQYGTRVATILVGLMALLVALSIAQAFVAPIVLAIVIGLMFGPVADRIEKRGVPPGASAAAVLLLFVMLTLAAIVGFALPLSSWMERLPELYQRVRAEVSQWQGMVASIEDMQGALSNLTGNEQNMVVEVEEGSAVQSVAFLAPGIVAQIVLFLAAMYFFLATRHGIRALVLSLCYNRRLRWRVAHIFRDVETAVSRYLISITTINVCVALVVSLALFAVGVPSPLLWGVLAGLLNYMAFIGPAVMVAVLVGVGLMENQQIGAILLPAMIYIAINFFESQFITPTIVGRVMTLNPFVVFLTVTFWIWFWGGIGGFLAVPMLIVFASIFRQIWPVTPMNPAPVQRAAERNRRTGVS